MNQSYPKMSAHAFREWIQTIDESTLESIRDQVAEKCDALQMQIDHAKADAAQFGEYKPAEWWGKINHALRCSRRERQALQEEYGRRRKSARRDQNNRVERRFVEVAKRRLDDELFASLMQEANEEDTP